MTKLQGITLLTYPVKDIAQAKMLYTKLLGVEPYADGGFYVGYKLGDQEIGLVPGGQAQGMTGPLPYFDVSDIKNTLKSMEEAGAQIQQELRDVGGGLLVASVKDKDGNITGFRQYPKKN
jgi:predicted enzyme related to lactoylglutathione lyase